MKLMVVFPPCKINLGLHIINKRADGYHNIETCFYPVPWTDILEIIPSEKFSFSSSGNVIPGKAEANLCIKAYQLLQRQYDLGIVQIHLHKIIPTGAGLGGGSSDAAYTLRLLNDVFQLNLIDDQLKAYAAQLGSDCSFFISSRPMIGTSRGEVLEETAVQLAGRYLIIIKPDVHVSTAEAYADITPKIPETNLKTILETKPVEEWRNLLKNDFEESVFKKFPVIKNIKDRLYEKGALYASMSGSGSAIFGLFEHKIELTGFENYTTWAGVL